MKKITLAYSLIGLTLLLVCNNSIAQVGINTTDPKGIIDFNSSTQGIVYPNVALTSTLNPSPVVNPQGGALAIGTAVYNTNTTGSGATTDVHPGIYVWDGTQWRIHYRKRQAKLFNQTSGFRPEANFATDFEDVPGLGVADANTFTAKYNGLYRIEVKTFFGAGRTESNGTSFAAMASGMFRFTFDGTDYDFETSAISAYNSYLGGGTHLEDIWKESYETRYVNLNAGDTYNFSLTFDAYDAPGFIGNGSTTTSQTSVDLINEDFDPTYTVTQTQSSTNCNVNGWTISTANPCSSCVDNSLYINSDDSSCMQNATAYMNFTPTVSSVDISFDYLFRERSGRYDSFRVYIRNESTMATTDLVYIDNSGSPTTDTSYSGSVAVDPGTVHTIRFEYMSRRARYASVDNVIISELSGPMTTVTEGRSYVGNEVDCQIEITYIGE